MDERPATGPLRQIAGTAIALRGNDIDTDRIMPARFLKAITFADLERHVFADERRAWRERGDLHPFDNPGHQGASILLVNRNFGCGSSREHAPQGLRRWGIRAVVGESFGEIFAANCLAVGVPCLGVAGDVAMLLQDAAEADCFRLFALDLEQKTLRSATILSQSRCPKGRAHGFSKEHGMTLSSSSRLAKRSSAWPRACRISMVGRRSSNLAEWSLGRLLLVHFRSLGGERRTPAYGATISFRARRDGPVLTHGAGLTTPVLGVKFQGIYEVTGVS